MALFKICRGAETNLPTTLISGYCYFCTDTTNFYIDYTDTYGALVRSKIAAKYADKLRYSQDGNYVEIDPTNIVTNSNYDTLINAATTSKNGLMAAADKKKLDGIASGANKTVVDTEVSDASENPVQNKVIKQYVDETVPKLGITSGATVGQLAKVKAVDENGVPTEWETVDDEPGTVVYTLTGSDANGYTIDGLDTPYTTIQAQIEAGKNVVLKRMSGIYSLAANASGMFIFVYQYNTLTDSITIKSDNTITKSSITLQTLRAMTDDISANAASTGKYPSTKGVADYVDSKLAEKVIMKTWTAADMA